tara:strand:- start:62159 stop:62830 length:672 start_codon:yes stop_codon:yes gene_type:complete
MKLGAIFDWDGVIVDSAQIHCVAWEALAKEVGKPLPEGHFEQGFGLKNTYIIPHILKWSQDTEEINHLSKRKGVLYRECLENTPLELLPGVKPLLEALQQAQIPCAVGSSTERLNIETILKKLDMEDAFAALSTAEDVSRGKPDPEVFLKAAAKIERDPACCVVFEDAVHGLEAARAGGMKTIGVATTHPKAILSQADIIVTRLSELTLEDLYALFSQTEAPH